MDRKINLFMENLENPFFISFSKLIDFVFNPEFLLVLGIFISLIFFFAKSRKKGIVLASLFISIGFLTKTFKILFARARPQNALIEATGYSLPSGHVAVAVVFLGIFTYLLSLKKSIKFKTLAYLLFSFLIIIISFSRIYLRVHWLTDVFVSLLVGGAVLIVGIIILSSKRFCVINI